MDLSALSLFDIKIFILIKVLFFGFVVLAGFALYKFRSYAWFPILLGIFSAASYGLLVQNMALPLWGMQGDEITIHAMIAQFSFFGPFSDFAYTDFPPFYPPLYFWIAGLLSSIFGVGAVVANKIVVFVFLLCFPYALYLLQKFVFKSLKNTSTEKTVQFPGLLSAALIAPLIFAVIDTDAIITKPYEVLSAAAIIIWVCYLIFHIHTRTLTITRIAILGITGGVIFLLYYFWFFLVALGLGLYSLFFVGKNTRWYAYRSYFFAAVATLIPSLIFIIPLVSAYQINGSENWQHGYFLLDGLKTFVVSLPTSIPSLVVLIGVVGMVWFRRERYMQILSVLFLSGYLWQLIGFGTIVFFDSPMQESKPFFYFSTILACFAAAFVFERLYVYLSSVYSSRVPGFSMTLGLLGIILISSRFIFGSFIEDPVVKHTRIQSRAFSSELQHLADFIIGEYQKDGEVPTTLHGGITKLYALAPMNDFIHYNMNNSHPAAHFSDRLLLLKNLSQVSTPEDFFELSQHNHITPIERMIISKASEKTGIISLYFHVDDFPRLNKALVVEIPRDLISSDFFSIVYENTEYAVLEPIEL